MKLLLLTALSTAASAISLEAVQLDDFRFTENALPADVLASLQAKIAGGATHVEASSALGDLFFGVAPGAPVPGKVGAGPVAEHQDRYQDGGAAGLVGLLYLDGAPEDKFLLRDMRTGVEHWAPIKPGLHVAYKNEYFTHRVEALEASTRFMLGPTSLKDGVLAPVGEHCKDADSVGAPDNILKYNCLAPPEGYDAAGASSNTQCCSVGEGGVACPYDGAVCLPLIDDIGYADRRLRGLKFGHHTMPFELGCCYCPDGRDWNHSTKECCPEESPERCYEYDNTDGWSCVPTGVCDPA